MGNFLKDSYKNKTVLVTGHTGFKGGWLSLWLKDFGCKVVGYSLEPPTQPNFFNAVNLQKHITHITGDIRDQNRLLSAFDEHQPEFVFHLAAQSLVLQSYKDPKLTYETNIMGTINVLEAARKTKSVKTCVVITSDKCYENKEWVYGYRETDPMGGYDPYSSSKGCAELVVTSYRNSFFDGCSGASASLSSVRAGNVIGGGDWAADRLIPDTVKALSSNSPIIIRKPFATRPWQYVLEPLGGYLLVGALMSKYGSKFAGAWNFGPKDANVVTVEELVKLAVKNWGQGSYKIDSPKVCPHEASLLKLDTSKAQMLLGWRPVYDINQTVTKTIEWYKQFYAKASKEDLCKLSINEIREYTQFMNDFDGRLCDVEK
jgi:CDP-glucose 4,6-dehydratase